MAIDLSLMTDDPARARRHAEAALDHYPGDVLFLARMGTILMAQHEWQGAAASLEQALRRHRDVELAYNLSYCYTWLGRQREAFDTLVGYGAEGELPAHAVTLLVRALHHLRELDRAIELIQAEMPRCQEAPAFLGAASMVYLDNGNIEESARLSELALAGGVRPVEALVVAASLALGRIDADAATRICNEVLAKNPTEGRSWSGLGLASMLKRDLPAAERQLEEAVRYMPGHPGTLHALGWCKILNQDLAGARAVFLKALELDRNFGDSHGGLAVVQAFGGERDAAGESIKRALGLDPNSLSAKFARMILDGKVSDPARFRALVPRLLAGYQGPFGQNLDAMLDDYEGS
ncbi:tetratricopeptide repeat protein [Massilia sp. Leaf139]|uniref:tetratricopeptide repeat protein n=1 Tax=Massilia sp. Leaf139 TaxID=1736272 RepID=UPI0006F678C3|nr:tetratricopeptide repeat protein [Massilia sp. Leaf139]KQQ92316.1 hypothetical protein ASF77_23190 [Massilia sp. Leaf139]